MVGRTIEAVILNAKDSLDNTIGMRRSSEHGDIISKLPDEILESIMARFTLQEVIATGILSTPWRHLCNYVTHLNFPPFKPEIKIPYQQDILTKRFQDYVNWIDHFLDSHKGNRVKEFKVEMYCLEGAKIDKWLEFALAKEAEIVEIHMKLKANARHRYSLQLHKLMIESQPRVTRRCLKEVSLSAIHVDDSEVELLLSNFPLLESLSIQLSEKLRKVSIVGRPALKHVGICHASNLQVVEIDKMMNLISLKFHALAPAFFVTLNNVPKLVEFNTMDEDHCTLGSIFSRVAPSICAQIRTLKIRSHWFRPPLRDQLLLELEFKSVKHLELEFRGAKFDGLFSLSRLFDVIQTCPTLEKLEIKMVWLYGKFDVNESKRIFTSRGPKREVSPFLKKMKWSGFLGSTPELGLAFSILGEVKRQLEEIIVEACDVSEELREIATARAWHHIPPRIHRSTILQVV